jgi:hypothetical protein
MLLVAPSVRTYEGLAKFQILTATSTKMAVFWDVAMMEAVSTSEMSVNFCPRKQPAIFILVAVRTYLTYEGLFTNKSQVI